MARRRLLVAVVVLVTFAVAACASDRAAPMRSHRSLARARITRGMVRRRARLSIAARVQRAEPVAPAENVEFYYQGISPRSGPSALAKLGRVRTVIAGYQRDSAGAATTIKATGALAYRYLQTYWYPRDRTWEGLDIGKHRDWAFCRRGSTPAVGRRDTNGTVWRFVDMNERAVQNALTAVFRQLVAEGWDGIFFDRGYAALAGVGAQNDRVWNRRSSCTADPVSPRATFADSFLALPKLARAAGLHTIVNYGVSPFDASTPMRPDPRRAACAAHRPSCPTRHDAWSATDQVLDESIGHLRGGWRATFVANRRTEQDPRFGGRTIGLVTSARTRGHDAEGVYYRWARAKLFAIPLGVNTGDHGCVRTAGPCDRNGLFPELAGITFGPPIDPQPVAGHCERHSRVRCVWQRRYTRGLSTINARRTVERVRVELGLRGCRYVLDVASGRSLAGGRCVDALTLRLRPRSGRPLQYSIAPF